MNPKILIPGQYILSRNVKCKKPDRRVSGGHWLNPNGLYKGAEINVCPWEPWNERSTERLTAEKGDYLHSIEIRVPGTYGRESVVVHVYEDGTLLTSQEGPRHEYVLDILDALELRSDGMGVLRQLRPTMGAVYDWESLLAWMLDKGHITRSTLSMYADAYDAEEEERYEREEAEAAARRARRESTENA